MQAQGELTYCPQCGKEIHPASEPCKHCGFAGESTSLSLRVHFDDRTKKTYRGFAKVRKLPDLSSYKNRGLIAVWDEDGISWFVYDRNYLKAWSQFFEYWDDTHDMGDEVPQYRVMDYELHDEKYNVSTSGVKEPV